MTLTVAESLDILPLMGTNDRKPKLFHGEVIWSTFKSEREIAVIVARIRKGVLTFDTIVVEVR